MGTNASVIKVEQYVFEKVKKSDVEIHIPNESIFYQVFNHRVVTGIFPKIADWNGGDNRVWRLDIIRVTENGITQASMDTNPRELSNIISRFDSKGKSNEDYLVDDVVRYLRDHFTSDRTTKKGFIAHLNSRLDNMTKIMQVFGDPFKI
jgi:hypothetical protein